MDLNKRFINIFSELDSRLQEENRVSEGKPVLPFIVKVLGQTALLLADLPFPIAGTMDLDAHIDGEYLVKKVLSDILKPEGLYLDPDSHQIWTPEEAQFNLWYKGRLATILLLESDGVIASKAKFKRLKDKILIKDYLQYFPPSKGRIESWGVSLDWINQ